MNEKSNSELYNILRDILIHEGIEIECSEYIFCTNLCAMVRLIGISRLHYCEKYCKCCIFDSFCARAAFRNGIA